MEALHSARRVARAQYGVLAVRQARACGLSADDIRHCVRRRRWRREHRGVYRLCEFEEVGWPPVVSAAMAAQLALGPRAFACRSTAARLWQMQGLPPWNGEVHMAVPPAEIRHGRPGLRLHRWEADPGDVTVLGRVRVTTPGRTLRDLVVSRDRETAVSLLDSALFQKLVTPAELRGLAAADRERRGAEEAGAASRWDLADGRAQSPLETRIRLVCADGGLPPDALQHPLHDGEGALLAYADMYWRRQRLLVEADGAGPHEQPSALLYDRRRRNDVLLAHPGLHILRFAWEDLRDPGRILTAVRERRKQGRG